MTKEQKDISTIDLYDKLNELKDKYGCMANSIIKIMEGNSYNYDTTHGFQLIMYSLKDEFKEIKTMLDNLLDNQSLFQNAGAGITKTEQGAWISREVAIKELKESIDKVKKFIDHNNKSKEKAESLLKRGEKLLQKYQGAA